MTKLRKEKSFNDSDVENQKEMSMEEKKQEMGETKKKENKTMATFFKKNICKVWT